MQGFTSYWGAITLNGTLICVKNSLFFSATFVILPQTQRHTFHKTNEILSLARVRTPSVQGCGSPCRSAFFISRWLFDCNKIAISWSDFQEKPLEFLAPKWRNWQTRWTQNPVRLTPGEGSSPSFGTCIQCTYLDRSKISGFILGSRRIKLRD